MDKLLVHATNLYMNREKLTVPLMKPTFLKYYFFRKISFS